MHVRHQFCHKHFPKDLISQNLFSSLLMDHIPMRSHTIRTLAILSIIVLTVDRSVPFPSLQDQSFVNRKAFLIIVVIMLSL
jgi:hypothetical protein